MCCPESTFCGKKCFLIKVLEILSDFKVILKVTKVKMF